jgi:Rap1a immunity proteins
MRRVLIVVAILAMPNQASAALNIYGNELYEMLWHAQKILRHSGTSEDFVPGTMGAGYVIGVIDSAENCVPPSIRRDQLLDITFRYLEAHPDQRRLPAPTLVRAAVAEKFPCPRGDQ